MKYLELSKEKSDGTIVSLFVKYILKSFSCLNVHFRLLLVFTEGSVNLSIPKSFQILPNLRVFASDGHCSK